MTELEVRIGDHVEKVQLEPNQTYRIMAERDGEAFVVTCEPTPAPVIVETGCCVVHRKPLYDGSDTCVECWDEYDAYLDGDGS